MRVGVAGGQVPGTDVHTVRHVGRSTSRRTVAAMTSPTGATDPTSPAAPAPGWEPSGGEAGGPGSAEMVDWDLAVRTASRLLQPGPTINRKDAFATVESLHELATIADRHVVEFTGLHHSGPTAPTRVIDRPAWVRSNADGMAALLGPIVGRLLARRLDTKAPGGGRTPNRIATTVGPRVTGWEAGLLFAFLADKVLGQYDVFGPAGGQLLLVAPNIVEAERTLRVDPHDFRLWVCLHECTHRLQFTAVPWLADHLRAEITALVDGLALDPKVLRERLGIAIREAADAARGNRSAAGEGLLALVRTGAARERLDRITAVMSLVEGHAEFVMDGVGPDVVPSVAAIRAKFTDRRRGSSPLDRMLRRLLGLEAKMRQYAEGSGFVRSVVDSVGMAGFNQVWRSPENLPSRREITAPDEWVQRVHGARTTTVG